MTTPGSLPWLVAFDLQLGLRAMPWRSGGAQVRAYVLIAAAFIAVLLMVRPVGRWIANAAADPARADALDGAMALGALIVFPWVASHALTGATRALYGRGDLDLPLSSPLPPHRILAARAIAVFLEATLAVGVFLAPLIASAMWFGGLRWAFLAPTLAGVGLLGAGLGVAAALGLFAVVGPKRTRQISQVAAMLIGVSFVALLQALNFLPDQFDARLAAMGQADAAPVASVALWAPVRAAQGDWPALLVLLAAGVAALAGVCALLGRAFVRSALQTAGAPAPAHRVSRWSQPLYTPSAGAAMRVKEWKLLARDPWLAGHLLMQAIYTLPIAGALWRLQPVNEGVAFIAGPALIIITAQFAAALAWVAVSSEDAPDLMASAPIKAGQERRHKLEALATPLLLLVTPAVLWLTLISPAHGPVVGAFAMAAGLSAALLSVWRPQPGRRSAIMRRYAQSKFVAVVEHLIAILWAMAALLFLQDKGLWLLLAGLALGALWLARPPRARETRVAKPAPSN